MFDTTAESAHLIVFAVEFYQQAISALHILNVSTVCKAKKHHRFFQFIVCLDV